MVEEKKSSMLSIIGYIIIIILVIFAFYVYYTGRKQMKEQAQSGPKIVATTDKYVYGLSDTMIINIDNETDKPVCFSSCYPYMFQYVDSQGWKFYNYDACSETDKVYLCLPAKQQQAFEIDLSGSGVLPAKHRLEVRACTECGVGQNFSIGDLIYSNDFIIE